MSQNRRFLTAVAIGAIAGYALVAGGCSVFGGGTDPVGMAVANGLDAGFIAIRDDAELGIRARTNAEAAEILGVPTLTDNGAQFARETLDYHQELINHVRARADGTIGRDVPVPAQD